MKKAFKYEIHHSDPFWGVIDADNFDGELIYAENHEEALRAAYELASGIDSLDWPLDHDSECVVWEVNEAAAHISWMN